MSIEKRVHPIPFRTRKLSASSPMILRIFTWESRPMPRLSLERLLIRSLSSFKGRVVHAALLRLKAPPQRRIWKGIFRRMFFAVVFSASGRSGQRKNAFPESLRLWTKHDVGPENDGQSGAGPKTPDPERAGSVRDRAVAPPHGALKACFAKTWGTIPGHFSEALFRSCERAP